MLEILAYIVTIVLYGGFFLLMLVCLYAFVRMIFCKDDDSDNVYIVYFAGMFLAIPALPVTADSKSATKEKARRLKRIAAARRRRHRKPNLIDRGIDWTAEFVVSHLPQPLVWVLTAILVLGSIGILVMAIAHAVSTFS
jgi:hypothetical protein